MPSKLEFMDQGCIRAVEDYLHMGLPVEAAALLLVDTDGDDPQIVGGGAFRVARPAANAAGEVRVARDPKKPSNCGGPAAP